MTKIINYVNFEKCILPTRDKAMEIRNKNAEKHIYRFDFTEMLNIVSARLNIVPISTEQHPSFTIPLSVFDEYLEAINIDKSEWMGIINRLANLLHIEYGYDTEVRVKRNQFVSDIRDLVVKL